MALDVYPLAFYVVVPITVCAVVFFMMVLIMFFNMAENHTKLAFCKTKPKKRIYRPRDRSEVDGSKTKGGGVLSDLAKSNDVAKYGFVADVNLMCFSKTIEQKDTNDEIRITFMKNRPPSTKTPSFIYSFYMVACLWISVLFAFVWFAIFDLNYTVLCGKEAESALEFNSTNCHHIDVNWTQCSNESSTDNCPFNRDQLNSLKPRCGAAANLFAECTNVAMNTHGGSILAIVVGLTKYVDFKAFVVATSVVRIRQTEAGHYGYLIRFVNIIVLSIVSIVTLGLPIALSVLKSQEQFVAGPLEDFVKSVPQEVLLFWQWADTKQEKLAVICTSAIFALNSFCTLLVTVYWSWKLALPPELETHDNDDVEQIEMTPMKTSVGAAAEGSADVALRDAPADA